MADNDIFDEPGFQLEGFYVTLIFCAVIGGPFLIAFFLCRHRMPWFYSPRSSLSSLEPDAPEEEIAHSWFGFVPYVLRYSNLKLFQEEGGIDTVIYLRFLRQAILLFTVFTVFGFVAIIPVNLHGNNRNLPRDDPQYVGGVNVLTMSNLEQGSTKMTLHTVTVVIYTFLVFCFQWQLARLAVDLNIQENQKLDSKRARTVMVTDLPAKSARNSHALYQLFSKMYRQGVTNCHVVPRNRGLRELAQMREKIYSYWILECDKYIEKGARKRGTIATIKDLNFFDFSHFWNRNKKEEGIRKTYLRVLKEMASEGKAENQDVKIAEEMEEDILEDDKVIGEEELPTSPMLQNRSRVKKDNEEGKHSHSLRKKIHQWRKSEPTEDGVDLPEIKPPSTGRAKQDIFLAHRKRQFDRYHDRPCALLVFPEEIERNEMPDDYFDPPPDLPAEQKQHFGLDSIDFYERVLNDLDRRIRIRQRRVKRNLDRKDPERPLHPFFKEGSNHDVENGKPFTIPLEKRFKLTLNSSSGSDISGTDSDSDVDLSRPITPEKDGEQTDQGRSRIDENPSSKRVKGGMTRVGFVTFRYVATAMACSQSIHKRDPGQCQVIPAPDPNNIKWRNLNFNSTERHIRFAICIAVLIAIFLFYAIPITFLSSISNLKSLSGVGFLRPIVDVIANNYFLRGVVGGFLPSAAINLFQQILPWILRLVLKNVKYYLRTDLDMAICKAFYAWLLLNVFLLNFITGSILDTISGFLDDPGASIEVVAVSLPSQAESFIEYIMIQGLIGYPLILFRIIDFIVYQFKLKFMTTTERQATELRKDTVETNYGYDSQFPQELIVFSIGLAYSTVAPLVALFTLLHFCLAFFSAKYQFIFVFKQPYQGYNLAVFILNIYTISLGCFHLIMLGIFISKVFPAGIVVSGVAFIVMIIFRIWLKRYTRPLRYVPLNYCNPEKLHPDETGKIEEITKMFTDPCMNPPEYIYESIHHLQEEEERFGSESPAEGERMKRAANAAKNALLFVNDLVKKVAQPAAKREVWADPKGK